MKRDVKVIGISADSLQTHFEWIEDIIEIASKQAPTCVEYPIVRPFFSLFVAIPHSRCS